MSMSGEGTAVIDLPALVTSGTLTARIVQTGSIRAGSGRLDFVASGDCQGSGYRDFVSGTTEVWVAYRSSGKTSPDGAIELRGLLHLLLHSTAPLLTEDVLSGTHYVVVTREGIEERFVGNFAGSVSEGDLGAPPIGAFVMLAGEGLVELAGETVPDGLPLSVFIPLDSNLWPPAFAEYLASLFDGAI
jgi:hypothetical protein